MQSSTAVVFLVLAALGAPSVCERSNPLGKVVELLESLEAKIKQEGEAGQRIYSEYYEWCDDATKNLVFDITTATEQKGKLEATIAKAKNDIEEATSKVDDLAAAIASTEDELEKATVIREKGHADFVAAERELLATIDTLARAIGILEKNAALAQMDASTMKGFAIAIGAVADAAALVGQDRARLTALLQSQSQQEEGEDAQERAEEAELGAPKAAVYENQSGNIIQVLEDLKVRAEANLADIRKAEAEAVHNHKLIEQSTQDEAVYDKKNLEEQKAFIETSEEDKAAAESELAVTNKELAEAKESLAKTQRSCMRVASDFETTLKGRSHELATIAKAKKILQETSSGAVELTYSLLQTQSDSGFGARAERANKEVIRLVKHLAAKYRSSALAQLASRIAVVERYGGVSADVFAKVKGLISTLIAKLEGEAEAEAQEKAWCDEQMAKTEAKRDELNEDLEKLTVQIDKAAAESAGLKADVKELQSELAAITKEQAQMDKVRSSEHDAYVAAKAGLQEGLQGVHQALDILKDYYGSKEEPSLVQQPEEPQKHEKAGGAGGGIIDILEVVESDFATNLAQVETEEEDASELFEKITQENKVATTMKMQDVKYKTEKFTALDKVIAELSSDKDGMNEELAAVLEYYAKVTERCVAKPETYEERKKRRDAEIAGLKEALATLMELSKDAFLLQRGVRTVALQR